MEKQLEIRKIPITSPKKPVRYSIEELFSFYKLPASHKIPKLKTETTDILRNNLLPSFIVKKDNFPRGYRQKYSQKLTTEQNPSNQRRQQQQQQPQHHHRQQQQQKQQQQNQLQQHHDSKFRFHRENNQKKEKPNQEKKSKESLTNNQKKLDTKKSLQNKDNLIYISLAIKDDVKLNETDNAWKSSIMQSMENLNIKSEITNNEISSKSLPCSPRTTIPNNLIQSMEAQDDNLSIDLYKKVRSILNKLTYDNFNILLEQIKQFNIDSMEKLNGVILLVFDKAINEPKFSRAYAELCKNLVTNCFPIDSGSMHLFKITLINKCQDEFIKNLNEQCSLSSIPSSSSASSPPPTPPPSITSPSLSTSSSSQAPPATISSSALSNLTSSFENNSPRIQEIRDELINCTNLIRRTELIELLIENRQRLRRQAVCTVGFIGELYCMDMLTTRIIIFCIKKLLDQRNEEKLECLCRLLRIVGRKIENKSEDNKKNYQDLNQYFNQMTQIADKNAKIKITSRIRFMIQDLIDLRNNDWTTKRS